WHESARAKELQIKNWSRRAGILVRSSLQPSAAWAHARTGSPLVRATAGQAGGTWRKVAGFADEGLGIGRPCSIPHSELCTCQSPLPTPSPQSLRRSCDTPCGSVTCTPTRVSTAGRYTVTAPG